MTLSRSLRRHPGLCILWGVLVSAAMGCGAQQVPPPAALLARASSSPSTTTTVAGGSCASTVVLKVGDQGSCVTQAQVDLEHLGVGGSPTGSFDAATRENVCMVQSASGLPSDGLIGPKTWAVLAGGQTLTPGVNCEGLGPGGAASTTTTSTSLPGATSVVGRPSTTTTTSSTSATTTPGSFRPPQTAAGASSFDLWSFSLGVAVGVVAVLALLGLRRLRLRPVATSPPPGSVHRGETEYSASNLAVSVEHSEGGSYDAATLAPDARREPPTESPRDIARYREPDWLPAEPDAPKLDSPADSRQRRHAVLRAEAIEVVALTASSGVGGANDVEGIAVSSLDPRGIVAIDGYLLIPVKLSESSADSVAAPGQRVHVRFDP